MKISLWGLNIRFDQAERNSQKIEDGSVDIMKCEEKKEQNKEF